MRGSALFPICLGAALALHVLPFLAVKDGGPTAAGSGSDGSGHVTLAAASQQLAQQAAQWISSPKVHQSSPKLAPPRVQSQPQFAASPVRPEATLPVSQLISPMPLLETVAVVDASPVLPDPPPPPPPARPIAPEKPAVAVSEARQQERAAGKQQQEIKGDAGTQTTTTADRSRTTVNHKNRWGAAIIARIQRQKRPTLGGGRGTVRLHISVSTKGRLIAVSVAQSSGRAALDQAAVRAVRRARLPRSPKEVSPGNYSFTFLMIFTD